MAEYQLIGLGTYNLEGEQCTLIISEGLKMGYRQIDTAQNYHNHESISQGIKLSQISREQIFIQSKINNTNITKVNIAESIDLIKKELDTDYLDLLLLHNPVTNYEESWANLIRCKEHFNIKNIGVSNFNLNHLEKIKSMTGILPWLNQIELNIFNQQNNLIKYHEQNNIQTQSHTTLTKGALLSNDKLVKLSSELILDNVNSMYKYVLDQGIGILPRTSNFSHLKYNYELYSKPKIFTKDYLNMNMEKIKLFDIGFKIY